MGLIAACKKRPISMKKIESIVDKIQNQLDKQGKTEIPSVDIGKMVMEELFRLDDIAYVRFASVYRKFQDKDDFVSEVKGLSRAEGAVKHPHR
jgi:transcriptional repressor NrdR